MPFGKRRQGADELKPRIAQFLLPFLLLAVAGSVLASQTYGTGDPSTTTLTIISLSPTNSTSTLIVNQNTTTITFSHVSSGNATLTITTVFPVTNGNLVTGTTTNTTTFTRTVKTASTNYTTTVLKPTTSTSTSVVETDVTTSTTTIQTSTSYTATVYSPSISYYNTYTAYNATITTIPTSTITVFGVSTSPVVTGVTTISIAATQFTTSNLPYTITMTPTAYQTTSATTTEVDTSTIEYTTSSSVVSTIVDTLVHVTGTVSDTDTVTLGGLEAAPSWAVWGLGILILCTFGGISLDYYFRKRWARHGSPEIRHRLISQHRDKGETKEEKPDDSGPSTRREGARARTQGLMAGIDRLLHRRNKLGVGETKPEEGELKKE